MLEKNKIPQENSISIRPGDDFTDVQRPIYISENQFGFDIWLFKTDKYGKSHLMGLYRDGIISRLSKLGYFKRYRDNNTYFFIFEQDNIIEQVEPINIKDTAFNYVKEQNTALEFNYDNKQICVQLEKLRETFLRQSHLIFNDNFLEHLPTHTKQILKDNKDTSFFFFTNTIISVSKSGMGHCNYIEFSDCCIWRKHIKDHVFEYTDNFKDCHFAKFIQNVTNNEEDRRNAFISAIGYLLHNYSHPSKGQAVILYDEDISDLKNPMGGTGKGLFANAIKQMRDVVKIDGKKFDARDKFKYQDITESTDVIWLDDVKPDLEFETLHSCLTDGLSYEQKFKPQSYRKPEDSPKHLITSNSVLKGDGTTNVRRQFSIEFSNHYSSQIVKGVEEPIKKEHGCLFFDKDDWRKAEWDMFFSYMLQCSLFYMKNGLVTYEFKSLNQNKLIQSTSDDFCLWLENQNFQTDIDYDIRLKFEDFRDTYYGSSSDFKQRTFTNWLKKFAFIKGCNVVIRKSNGTNYMLFQNKK